MGHLSEEFGTLLESLRGVQSGAGKVFFAGLASNSFYSDLVGEYGAGSVKNDIQDALDACTAARGDIVVVLPGAYTLTTALTMSKADVTLAGVGFNQCRINGSTTAGQDCIVVSADGCTVRGLTLAPDNTTGYGIDCGADDFLVEDCLFDEGTTNEGNGFGLDGSATARNNITIRRCVFDNLADGVLLDDSTAALSGIYIEDCKFYSCSSLAVDIQDGTGGTTGLFITGCHFADCAGVVLDLDQGTVEVMVSDCFIMVANAAALTGVAVTDIIGCYTQAGVTPT